VPRVTFAEPVREFLRTHPAAEEVRVLARLLERGRLPSDAVSIGDEPGESFVDLDCGWALWWYYTGSSRETLLLNDVTPPG
jgi:hypothetical protein